MSLTVKHLNADASFLLTFSSKESHHFQREDSLPSPSHSPIKQDIFTVLIDPWLTGSSKIFHSKFSISTHAAPSCVSSLAELPEPDLVIISQSKTDHCHRETLTQLPPRNTKTQILAEPGAAKIIRSWKYFEGSKIKILEKFDENSKCKTWVDGQKREDNSTIYRIPIPASIPHKQEGEIRIAYITQKYDFTKLHSAIGITYQPPISYDPHDFLPSPPDSPHSTTTIDSSYDEFLKDVSSQPISIIYSPHGITYPSLIPYTNQLRLPLTLLLHCFDRISNPWYMGGTICSGLTTGGTIALNLKARTWISAHDGDKLTKGLATVKTTSERFGKEEVEEVVSPRSNQFPSVEEVPSVEEGTRAVILGIGKELSLGNGRG